MINRRTAIQNIVLTSGALVLGSTLPAQPPAPPEAEGVFKLPPLGYDYDALEPFIDAETMKIHHDKHHAAYVARLNQAIARVPTMAKQSVEELLQDLNSLPEDIREEVRNYGGGHANHSLLWETLKKSDAKPAGDLATAITNSFGDLSAFESEFTKIALGVFGSGWAWLVWREGKLTIEATADQDSPHLTGGNPLLGLDVWEHAYYLKYQNKRAEYAKAFFSVVNWDAVASRFAAAAGKAA
jgi:Fe-Mn family superoxide dismutase